MITSCFLHLPVPNYSQSASKACQVYLFSLLLNRLFCAVSSLCTIMSRLVCVTPALSLTAGWNEAMLCWSKARLEKCLNKCQHFSERIPQTKQARKIPEKYVFIETYGIFPNIKYCFQLIFIDLSLIFLNMLILVRGAWRSMTGF